MLTGDKLETAISIGKATKLLNNDVVPMIVNADTAEGVLQELEGHMLT